MLAIADDQIWIVVLGFVISFVLAFGFGANDVANSFGTSVGSKVLTLRQACVLATVCETAGAVLLGAKVSETIRKGIIDVEMYNEMNVNGTTDGNELLMVGQLSSLSGACIWLLVATFFRVPVSGTHSIVGATVGFALVATGTAGINWRKLGLVVASWFVSPLLSGAISVGLFYCIKLFVLCKNDPLEPGLRILPLVYSVTIVINVFSIVYEGPDLLRFNLVPLWGAVSVAFLVGTASSLVIKMLLVPWQRRRIVRDVKVLAEKEQQQQQQQQQQQRQQQQQLLPSEASAGGEVAIIADSSMLGSRLPEKIDEDSETPKASSGGVGDFGRRLLRMANRREAAADYKIVNSQPETAATAETEKTETKAPQEVADKPEQSRIFAWLQVLTAIFGSFAHGGNDVSNAIGPLIGLWIIATTGSIGAKTMTPVHILLFGGVGISVGLWAWGRRVIQTLGEDLTTITPSSGFCIELGAAIAVLLASNIGIPVSTTHCKVGSVVFVGFFRSRDNVRWSIFRNILVAWLVTLPISGAISGGMMAALRALVL